MRLTGVLALLFVLWLAAPAGAATVGISTVGAQTDSADAGCLNVARVTMPAGSGGTLESLSVYIRAPIAAAPANQYALAIYADAAGSPSTLLGASAAGTLTGDAWNLRPMPAVALAAGTPYWLAYLASAAGPTFNNLAYTLGSAGQFGYRCPVTFGAFPTPAGAVTASDLAVSFFATYTPTSSTPPSWPVPGVTVQYQREPASLILDWTDNATNEDGTQIERRPEGGVFAQIADLSIPNLVTFADGTLTLGLTYCYRVRAYNTAGASAYSNEVCGVAR